MTEIWGIPRAGRSVTIWRIVWRTDPQSQSGDINDINNMNYTQLISLELPVGFNKVRFHSTKAVSDLRVQVCWIAFHVNSFTFSDIFVDIHIWLQNIKSSHKAVYTAYWLKLADLSSEIFVNRKTLAVHHTCELWWRVALWERTPSKWIDQESKQRAASWGMGAPEGGETRDSTLLRVIYLSSSYSVLSFENVAV